jgi:homoserine O-acetyltransferase
MLSKITRYLSSASFALFLAASVPAVAQPAPANPLPLKDGVYVIKNFRFGTGETLPELKLHYLTLGTPHRNAQGHVDNAVLLLHGTGGSAHSLTVPRFADFLFGPGQTLDTKKYFLIFPDDIGHGDPSKPSDGMHMRFPHYDYDDMVRSQYIMLTEGMHVDHLRLIFGTSMGCMQGFVWGETYPKFMDALAPFACNAVEIAGRNREFRYMSMQLIRKDPAWKNGEYTTEPIVGLTGANYFLMIAGGAPLQLQKNYPTRALTEAYVDKSVDATNAHTDANNLLYYTNASRNYNPSPKLGTIVAPMLWVNSADDFVNPPELGMAQQLVKRIPHGRFILIPISDATRGHSTHTEANVWKDTLAEFMRQTEPK